MTGRDSGSSIRTTSSPGSTSRAASTQSWAISSVSAASRSYQTMSLKPSSSTTTSGRNSATSVAGPSARGSVSESPHQDAWSVSKSGSAYPGASQLPPPAPSNTPRRGPTRSKTTSWALRWRSRNQRQLRSPTVPWVIELPTGMIRTGAAPTWSGPWMLSPHAQPVGRTDAPSAATASARRGNQDTTEVDHVPSYPRSGMNQTAAFRTSAQGWTREGREAPGLRATWEPG